MTDDDSASNDVQNNSRENSEFSEVSKGGESTNPGEMPEGGYVTAPTSNNPDQGAGGDDGSSSDSTDSE